MATDEGGYNYNFVEPPPERLLCKICQFPCREARSNEDNVYCKGCVSRIKIKSSDSVSNKCERNAEYVIPIMYVGGL